MNKFYNPCSVTWFKLSVCRVCKVLEGRRLPYLYDGGIHKILPCQIIARWNHERSPFHIHYVTPDPQNPWSPEPFIYNTAKLLPSGPSKINHSTEISFSRTRMSRLCPDDAHRNVLQTPTQTLALCGKSSQLLARLQNIENLGSCCSPLKKKCLTPPCLVWIGLTECSLDNCSSWQAETRGAEIKEAA